MNTAFPDYKNLIKLGRSKVKIFNLSRNSLIADDAKIAKNFLERLIGLLNRNSLNKNEALILAPSNCIHSLFMRFTIDVLFLNKSGKVIGMLPLFKPFRLGPLFYNAFIAIELPGSTIKLTQTQLGDSLSITAA